MRSIYNLIVNLGCLAEAPIVGKIKEECYDQIVLSVKHHKNSIQFSREDSVFLIQSMLHDHVHRCYKFTPVCHDAVHGYLQGQSPVPTH